MFFWNRKKIKILRALANLVYVLEKDNDVKPISYSKMLDFIWEVAYLTYGFKGMDYAFKYYVELKQRGDN